jgi:hypothetical protein
MLFQYQKFAAGADEIMDTVHPALSPVRFTASSGDFDSSTTKATYVHKLPSEAIVTGWQLPQAHIELLLCPLKLSLLNGRTVDGCYAAMWRIRALEEMQTVSFSAKLLAVPEPVEIGPESGEGVDAQSWTANGQVLMLSTEDGDFLAERAKLRDWMPFRFQRSLASRFPYYLPDGITVRVPGLDSAELCQVQFVVAWASDNQSDNPTWYAADRNPAEILSAAGCS